MCVRPAVPPKFPPLQAAAHCCRNAAVRYRLLSFTDTAQKAVSPFFVPGRSQTCLPSLYGRFERLMSLSLLFSYINIKTHSSQKKGRVCVRPAVPPKFPPLQAAAHCCRNAAIRYRLLSFTDTAQKAVSPFFVPGRSQPCLPSLYGRLK
ncbi:hypothetical protein DALLNEIH_00885 [Bacillus sp. B01(2024)]|nr:hypothetical protein SRCM100169_01241 [Bacillus siamensis]